MRSYPGFDILRLIAASLVVFSHSFLIVEGTEDSEPFRVATGQSLGLTAVYVFFVLSGLLITESARRSSSLGKFMTKRIARIFPAFITCNLLLVVLVSPFFLIVSRTEFLTNPDTWAHLHDVLTFKVQAMWFYESVKFYPSRGEYDFLPSVVNGVIWTIRQEFTCYMLIAVLMTLGLLGRVGAVIMVGIAAIGVITVSNFPSLKSLEYLPNLAFVLPSFAVGVGMQVLKRGHQARGLVAAIMVTLLAVIAFNWDGWSSWAHVAFPILSAYPLLWFGQKDWRLFRWTSQFGDPSYGTYLWGWPIQQVVRSLTGDLLSAYALAAICIPLALVFGYASWCLVEAPMLRAAGRRPHHPELAGAASTLPKRTSSVTE